MSSISMILIFAVLGSFLLTGCVPKPPAKVQQSLTVTIQAPPNPPSPEELEKPPNLVLERAERDPFVTLAGEGESVPTAGGGGTGGIFIVSGIMTGGPHSSAILESGANSYIVHAGDHVGGYRVSSITSRSVVLVKGKEKLVLTFLQ